jgi:hypothetical protein
MDSRSVAVLLVEGDSSSLTIQRRRCAPADTPPAQSIAGTSDHAADSRDHVADLGDHDRRSR